MEDSACSEDFRRSAKLRGETARCVVSYLDIDGLRHSVEVDAESLFEAAVLGLCAFSKART